MYMAFSAFERGECCDEMSFQDRLREFPLIQYAARFWGKHVREGKLEEDADIQQNVVEIWKSRDRANALGQARRSNNGPNGWELTVWFRGMTVLHALVDDNLTTSAQAVVWRPTGDLSPGANPDANSREELIAAETDGGITALCLAAQLGRVEVIELLLATNIGIQTTMKGVFDPLNRAASEGYSKIVAKLLQAALSLDLKDVQPASGRHR